MARSSIGRKTSDYKKSVIRTSVLTLMYCVIVVIFFNLTISSRIGYNEKVAQELEQISDEEILTDQEITVDENLGETQSDNEIFIDEFAIIVKDWDAEVMGQHLGVGPYEYNGLEITQEQNDASDTFYFNREFFETLNEMSGQYVYVYVIYQEKIISAELIIFGTENAYSYLGGTDKEYFNVRPNDFLKFEAIKWLKEHGLKNFVLGGGYGADDGIFRYKKSLAPNGIVDFYIGRNIFNKELYSHFVQMRESGDTKLNEQFFPLYRAEGKNKCE